MTSKSITDSLNCLYRQPQHHQLSKDHIDAMKAVCLALDGCGASSFDVALAVWKAVKFLHGDRSKVALDDVAEFDSFWGSINSRTIPDALAQWPRKLSREEMVFYIRKSLERIGDKEKSEGLLTSMNLFKDEAIFTVYTMAVRQDFEQFLIKNFKEFLAQNPEVVVEVDK